MLSVVGPQNDAYAFQEGTSMAAPHAAGVVSLMRAVNPGITREQILTTLTLNGDTCTGCDGKPALTYRCQQPIAPGKGLPARDSLNFRSETTKQRASLSSYPSS